jgi:hypothetical protein
MKRNTKKGGRRGKEGGNITNNFGKGKGKERRSFERN